MSDEPSLLDQFRQRTDDSDRRCAVCHKITPEARAVVEDAIRRGIGAVTTSNFLRDRGLWRWSEQPIITHKRHWQP